MAEPGRTGATLVQQRNRRRRGVGTHRRELDIKRERGVCYMTVRRHTLVQEQLFPIIVNLFLRVRVLLPLVHRSQGGKMLCKCRVLEIANIIVIDARTSTSRINISDLRLPFLIEPTPPKPRRHTRPDKTYVNSTHREKCTSPYETTSFHVRTAHNAQKGEQTSRYSSPCLQ